MKYQTVYIIERKFNEAESIEYRTISEGMAVWTKDVWDALWFTREEDAHKFAYYVNGDIYERFNQIVEHRMYNED